LESIEKQLQFLIDEGRQFTFDNFSDREPNWRYGGNPKPEWIAWQVRVNNLLLKTLDENAAPLKILGIGLGMQTRGNPADSFESAKANLLSALQQTLDIITKQDTFNELKGTTSQSKSSTLSNRVFIVHGHDNQLKVELENFIKDIGLEPIVLHRKPDEGQTIIEKFEKHSDVGFAFVLLTPDEIAYSMDQEATNDKERLKEKRARPNVIFEFGYFVGKLGRNRVCCIYKGNVTLPSDLSGLVYKKVDGPVESEGYSIIKELKAAGYKINI
jgi:predicted nucleotide-binding protein